MKDNNIIKSSDFEFLYNIYDRTICVCRVEKRIDGDVLFFDLDSNELIDFESYADVGYKLLKIKKLIFDQIGDFTINTLNEFVDNYNSREKRDKIDNDALMDLNWLADQIEQNKYDYDQRYPVEQIEIRYSTLLNDYMFVFVKFDSSKRRLSYMDVSNGMEVEQEKMDLYDYYPRDDIFDKADYSPRELSIIRDSLNKGLDVSIKRKRR